jgi:hypothetical protein
MSAMDNVPIVTNLHATIDFACVIDINFIFVFIGARACDWQAMNADTGKKGSIP